MAKAKPTFNNLVGFYIEPIERPTWTGEIVNLKTGELVKEASMTKQSFKEECDINNIVRKFEATGQFDHVNAAAQRGLYTDLPSGLDLQAGLNMIAKAEEGFRALPAATRAFFDNDAVKFVDYVDRAHSDPKMQQQLIDWGVATDNRKPDPEPQKVEVVNLTPPPPKTP